MNDVYYLVKEKIDQADAVLIGASNGLSISEGFNLFADDAWFRENFGDFRQKFGIQSVLQGAFFPFPTQEEKWAFRSRLVYQKSYAEPPSRMMQVLYQLVADKDYFVVTSNGEDHFIPAGFSAERVFELEGKFTENGCEHGCHDGAYPNREDKFADTLIPQQIADFPDAFIRFPKPLCCLLHSDTLHVCPNRFAINILERLL